MGTKRSPGSQHTPKGFTQGNILVDPTTGNPISTVDDNGIRRLAVDANFVAQNVQANVNLDSNEDEVAVEDPDTGAHIRVEADGSINVNTAIDAAEGDSVAIGAHPNQIFDENADTITTASFEEIYTFTSSDNKTRIASIWCTVSTPSQIRMKVNGNIKKLLRTSPLERNIEFNFKEHYPLLNGQVLSIEAKVERLNFNQYESFVSLEGYVE